MHSIHSACYTFMHRLKGLERLLSVIYNVSMPFSNVSAANIAGHLNGTTEETLQMKQALSFTSLKLDRVCGCTEHRTVTLEPERSCCREISNGFKLCAVNAPCLVSTAV